MTTRTQYSLIHMPTTKRGKWFVARRSIGETWITVAECHTEYAARELLKELRQRPPKLERVA
jgi:hypothetical protein